MALLRRRFALMLATSGQPREAEQKRCEAFELARPARTSTFLDCFRAITVPAASLLSEDAATTGSGNRPYAQTAVLFSVLSQRGSDEQRDSLSLEPQCSHDRDACGAGSRKIELPHTKRRGQVAHSLRDYWGSKIAHRRRGGEKQYGNRGLLKP